MDGGSDGAVKALFSAAGAARRRSSPPTTTRLEVVVGGSGTAQWFFPTIRSSIR